MALSIPKQDLGGAIARYGLSKRAASNTLQDLPWDSLEKMLGNLWSLDNPNGLVFLGVAENPLLQQEVATYINNRLTINPAEHLGYGAAGPRGSPRLKQALTAFFNSHQFRARQPVLPTELVVLPGAVAVLDALVWSVCNEGEGILVPQPFYTGFRPAAGERARGVLVPASFRSLDGYRSLDDIFEPAMNKKAFERALRQAAYDGIKVRAVMLSKPGQPAETLREIASFCGRNNLHLICDEVFAKSGYDSPRGSEIAPFTSILAVDWGGCIDPHLVHVAYGMGKDFCATGLRLGVLHSRNPGLVKAVTSVCVFGWVPYVTQEMWADMLLDETFLTGFFAKNRAVLAEHCAILTSFLEQHEIPYYANVNAGVFIWVDLRRYLRGGNSLAGGGGAATSLSIGALSPSELTMYRDREAALAKRCMQHGVGISPGSGFSTEELGWFRIGFAVERQALQTGLQRLWGCLEATRRADAS
ncbi:1-aminocyclopropane-1-carboxylate synthase [Apiospora marii]|uniref:1-aminocyclopropane-1-carboxylate synthase n=1 Tax=Apiospora marii TaxID=335849 RepID=A0ABR1RQM9_9PEZI